MRFMEFLRIIDKNVLTEAKFRKPIEMYHGTSSKFLRTILKQGIVPDPKDKKWSDDPHASLYSLSRVSLPGSYWTSNFLTAVSSSTSTTGKFGGSPIIVIGMISEGSSYADEDSISYDILGILPEVYKEMFGSGIVAEYVPKIMASMYWAGEHGDEMIRGQARDRGKELPDDTRVSEHILEIFSRILHEKLADNPEKQPINHELMKTLLEGLMLRGMAFEQKDNKWGSSYLSDFKEKQKKGLAPPIPELEEIEQQLLELRDQMTRSYPKTARYDADAYNHTLRTVHPVTFRGANKIIGIIEEGKYVDQIPDHWRYQESPTQPGAFAYFDEKGQRTGAYSQEDKSKADAEALKSAKDEGRILTLHYGTITDEFIKQYQARIGQFPGMVDTNGKMIMPSERVNEGRLDEIYSSDVSALKRYLAGGEHEIDAYYVWSSKNSPVDPSMADWLLDHYPQLITPWMKEEGVDDPNKLDPEYSTHVPLEPYKQYAAEVGDDYVEWMMQNDPAEAPSTAYFSGAKIMPRTTWLVHFSDNAWDIASEGFTQGIDQMDKLGLTTNFGDQAKKYGGFNFAFDTDSRYAINAAKQGKYGSEAVMFTNSGVESYHVGDEEDQIIFPGKDVDPRNIIYLAKNYDIWCVKPHPNQKRAWKGEGYRECVYQAESFYDVVAWVENHWQQYAKIIMGW